MSFDKNVFRVSEAVSHGISPGRLRSARHHRPFWGIRAQTNVSPEEAFAPRMPARGFYFGLSAARLHRIPVPLRLSPGEHIVDVAVPAGVRRPAAKGVRSHHVRIAAADITRVAGLRVTTPARTWCDLAASGLQLPELVAAGDALIHQRHGLCQPRDLRRSMARYEGRRGAAVMRAAIEILSARADSPPESELRVAILMAGLPAPVVNEPVSLPRGRTATPDLSWPRWKVAMEYEGDHHRTDRDQWRYDLARYDELADLGWRVIRATGEDYRDPDALIRRLSRLLPTRESTYIGTRGR